jgi:hypothetical protein
VDTAETFVAAVCFVCSKLLASATALVSESTSVS